MYERNGSNAGKYGNKYFVAGAYSGFVAAGLGTMMQGAPLDSADLIFAGLLGGSAAYAGYKMADVVTRNNARTTVEDTNAKIKATEDPVKENTGNTSSKNSNQNNGGSKNSGKNNANTENNSTAKNNNATKNNAKNSQTPLEENANAARNGAETDTCPLSKGSTETVNVGKRDLVELRSRLGVPETDTIAVEKTNVKGLEDLTFEG